ncbi:transposase, partial [Streptomyces sp. NPDC059455]
MDIGKEHHHCVVITANGEHDQPMVYITGLTVHRASASYRGEAKTDAKDA